MWNADFCENVTNLKPLGSRAGREKFDVDNVFVGIHKLFTTGRLGPPERVECLFRVQKCQDISPFFVKLFPEKFLAAVRLLEVERFVAG